MENITSSAPAAYIAGLESDQIESYCGVAVVAFVLYEHISTIADEVQFVWGSRISSTVLLFHLNRWLILLWALALLLTFLPANTIPIRYSCMTQNLAGEAIEMVLYVVWAAFSAIRVRGVRGSRTLSLAVCALYLIPVGTNIYSSMISVAYEMVDLSGGGMECIVSPTLSEDAMLRFTIVTRTCVIAADAIVIIVTWLRTRDIMWGLRKLHIKQSIPLILLRDGTAYFTLLLALNIMQIIGDATETFIFTIGIFGTPICSIVISRFLLGLRRGVYLKEKEWKCETLDNNQSSSISIFFADMSMEVHSVSDVDRALPASPMEDPDVLSVVELDTICDHPADTAPSPASNIVSAAEVDLEGYYWEIIDIMYSHLEERR
ncbi:hypothetical protein OBBRIDRAFT_37434 [Obba rivulosa]|uniref:DUF6533 domain-containing protein n=1 Tax=Obba rivulosa TaxID=1052685 RepID=A0A8E2AQK5_9APHY|nr:hypothetical protein OBBRIDRAFT_37434 [Obba rivulosa]